MKLIISAVCLVLALVCGAVGFIWFDANYVVKQIGSAHVVLKRGDGLHVAETQGGGEFLILKSEQFSECSTGGGCAVFSRNEFERALMQWLMMNRKSL
jgi:hypothetical protein